MGTDLILHIINHIPRTKIYEKQKTTNKIDTQ